MNYVKELSDKALIIAYANILLMLSKKVKEKDLRIALDLIKKELKKRKL